MCETATPIRWPVIEILMRAFLLFLSLLRGQQPLSGSYTFLGGGLFNRGQNLVSVLRYQYTPNDNLAFALLHGHTFHKNPNNVYIF